MKYKNSDKRQFRKHEFRQPNDTWTRGTIGAGRKFENRYDMKENKGNPAGKRQRQRQRQRQRRMLNVERWTSNVER